jgi:hypothetical protein
MIDNKTIYKNNKVHITMDTTPVIIDGRAFVPIRAITEALGKSVEFYEDEKVRVIAITDAKIKQDLLQK